MQLIWPMALVALALVPALVALYLWMLRRRRRYAVRYSSLALVREALEPGVRWRRHIPFVLFLLSLLGLVLALARPVALVQVPTNQTAILLAIDISRSMCATDIPPNRLEAAKVAALDFIRLQPEGTKIGVVAFAGFAELVQTPTTDREALATAVTGLATARGTAIGSGILEALEAISALNPAVPPLSAADLSGVGAQGGGAAEPVPQIIVLLTDGVTTTGAPPLLAAELAAERGVRVYTIGFGTSGEALGRLDCGGQQFGGGPPFGGQAFGGGGGFRRGIDEETLEEIAELTGGAYYAASSAGELQAVFEGLPLTFVTRAETTEVTALVAAAGALLAALAICLSLWWNPSP